MKQELPKCPYCGRTQVRVTKDGKVYCNSCEKEIVKQDSGIKYIKCHNCGYPVKHPSKQQYCPRCGKRAY